MNTSMTAQRDFEDRPEHRHACKVAVVTCGALAVPAASAPASFVVSQPRARVTFTYASANKEADALVASVRESGGDAAGIRGDSADRAEIRDAITSVADREGRLDIVVSNADSGTKKPVQELEKKAPSSTAHH